MRIDRVLLAAVFAASTLLVGAAGTPGSGYTVTDQAGRTVTVPANPARIISLAPNITEILYAVGAGALIVGVSEYSNYPPEAAALPMVGTYIKPNLEAIISLSPDLVIATADGEKTGRDKPAGRARHPGLHHQPPDHRGRRLDDPRDRPPGRA